MLTAILVLAVFFVAFTNGANANFKGVASLYGTGTLSRRAALYWGTFATFAGSITAFSLASGMLKTFSGKGIVPDELVQSSPFVTAVALGAATTSFLATRLGFPVSTTHALIGSLLGAGFVSEGSAVNLVAALTSFLYPLMISPLLAIFVGMVIYTALRAVRLAPENRTRTLDTFHFCSTGIASFARGLNDTPKMAALLMLVPQLSGHAGFIFVGTAIAIGALIDADRVAETLGKKVTDMDPGQGFAASVVTAILVTTASFHSLPVSTTHVSVGALVGIGARTHQAKWRKIFEIFLAWFTTAPCGALLASLSYLVIEQFV